MVSVGKHKHHYLSQKQDHSWDRVAWLTSFVSHVTSIIASSLFTLYGINFVLLFHFSEHPLASLWVFGIQFFDNFSFLFVLLLSHFDVFPETTSRCFEWLVLGLFSNLEPLCSFPALGAEDRYEECQELVHLSWVWVFHILDDIGVKFAKENLEECCFIEISVGFVVISLDNESVVDIWDAHIDLCTQFDTHHELNPVHQEEAIGAVESGVLLSLVVHGA